jgi:N-acetylmuramoyl-L-alanine amidase
MILFLAIVLAGFGATKTEAAYSEEDLWYLSRIIQAESGYCEREMQEGVGSVLINRRDSDLFPNSIRECAEQPGQYSTLGWLESQEPTEQVMEVAIDLLENGSKYPADVLYQANFPQGSGIYKTLSTSYSVMYFCYQ